MYLMAFLSVICLTVQNPTRRLRRQQNSFQTYVSCLQSVAESKTVDALQYVKQGGCAGNPGIWQLRCRIKRLNRNCHFFATCTKSVQLPAIGRDHVWICQSVHSLGDTLYSYCCDPICPSSNGRK